MMYTTMMMTQPFDSLCGQLSDLDRYRAINYPKYRTQLHYATNKQQKLYVQSFAILPNIFRHICCPHLADASLKPTGCLAIFSMQWLSHSFHCCTQTAKCMFAHVPCNPSGVAARMGLRCETLLGEMVAAKGGSQHYPKLQCGYAKVLPCVSVHI